MAQPDDKILTNPIPKDGVELVNATIEWVRWGISQFEEVGLSRKITQTQSDRHKPFYTLMLGD